MIEDKVWQELDEFQDSMGEPYRLNDYSLALFMEVAELVDSTNWKPWKGRYDDVENIKREICDCIFFLHHIARKFDISPEDLRQKYEEVMKNNRKRYSNKI